MHNLIRIISAIIILLGIVHISFAFPLHMNTETLWFTGAGMAIIFSGFLNLAAIDRGGSVFTKGLAFITNAINCALFAFAVPVLDQPQVYIGIVIFLIAMLAFAVELIRHRKAGTIIENP